MVIVSLFKPFSRFQAIYMQKIIHLISWFIVLVNNLKHPTNTTEICFSHISGLGTSRPSIFLSM